MITQPLMAGILGGWEIVLILAALGVFAFVAVAVVIIAVVVTKNSGRNKQATSMAANGSQPPPLHP